MRGNYILHSKFNENIIDKYNPQEVRFTRALTKYSSEFNNFNFIQSMCQKLSLNKSDLFAYFQNIKSNNEKNTENHAGMEELLDYLSNYDVSKLEVERMFRMITKEDSKKKKKNSKTTHINNYIEYEQDDYMINVHAKTIGLINNHDENSD
jgi:signal recognition particle GTPase